MERSLSRLRMKWEDKIKLDIRETGLTVVGDCLALGSYPLVVSIISAAQSCSITYHQIG
jgi:hypothetical protein